MKIIIINATKCYLAHSAVAMLHRQQHNIQVTRVNSTEKGSHRK